MHVWDLKQFPLLAIAEIQQKIQSFKVFLVLSDLYKRAKYDVGDLLLGSPWLDQTPSNECNFMVFCNFAECLDLKFLELVDMWIS